MIKNFLRKTLIVLMVITVFGFGAYAFADWGMGPGMMGGLDHQNHGRHHRDYGYYGYRDMMGNFSDDEIQELNSQRYKFFKATENLRQDLYAKQLELRSELAKENPDTSKASKLKSDISTLQSNLDQERLNYEIKARKSAPGYNRSRGGYGPMMDYSPRGGGYCMW